MVGSKCESDILFTLKGTMSVPSSPVDSVEEDDGKVEDGNYLGLIFNTEGHPPTNECDDPECMVCGYRDCPYHCPEHYWHDGCPICYHLEEGQ